MSAAERQAEFGDLVASILLPPARELARRRAGGCLNHIAMTVRLGRTAGMDARALAAWNLDMMSEHGYFDEWIRREGAGNLDAFLGDFVSGRQLIYDDTTVSRTATGFEVTSRLWYHDDPPELFYYLDLAPEELSEYIVALGVESARRLGVALSVEHGGGVERARIARLTEEAL